MTDEVWSFDGDRNESKYNIQTGEKVKINLRAMTKAAIERIVARGHVENEEEQILISTAALLCDFLLSKGGNCQPTVRLREYQRDVGRFFPPLVEAILEWVKEGKQSIIEKIKELDGDRKNHD